MEAYLIIIITAVTVWLLCVSYYFIKKFVKRPSIDGYSTLLILAHV